MQKNKTEWYEGSWWDRIGSFVSWLTNDANVECLLMPGSGMGMKSGQNTQQDWWSPHRAHIYLVAFPHFYGKILKKYIKTILISFVFFFSP